jgi:murein DD-endopeptidase MepM/ murein hydrolase activator NlpD
MQHFDARIGQRDDVTVAKVRIEIDDAWRFRQSDPMRLHFQRAVQGQIGRMQQRAPTRALTQRSEVADVIDMRVRVQQMSCTYVTRMQAAQHLVDAVAAVDHNRLAGCFVGQNRAVAAQRTHCKGFDNHAAPYARTCRAACRYSPVVDIQFDLAQVQARIAQIAGGPPIAPEPVANGDFASLVNAASTPVEPPAPASGSPMQWPVAGQITSPFGERRNPMGAGEDFHPGVDIAADEGAPITAAAAGRVISAGPDGGYGNLIAIDNGNGITTRYAHCSQIFARVGDTVSPGQTIAAIGSTGHSTGPHLHFEVRINDQPVDPTQFLPQ